MRDDAPATAALPDRADVAVVGGGIAGAAATYHLRNVGLDAVLLEKDRIAGGATEAAVGILSPPIRQPFHETVHFRGQEAATQLWLFALRSVEGLGSLLVERGEAQATGLDLRGGYVLAEPHTHHKLEGSFAALRDAGLPVEWISADAVRRRTGGRGFTGGFRIDGLGGLRPGPTARALADAAVDLGAHVVEHAAVNDVQRSGPGFAVSTERGIVEARYVVYAGHVDSGRLAPSLDRHIVPIRGQALVTKPLPHRFEGAYATGWKLNVWRQDPSGRILVSGWRHDAWERSYGETEPKIDPRLQGDLQHWFEAAFPDLGELPVERRWSGLFGWTADYLPLVGWLPGRPGTAAITGFSGGGLPFAFECGRLLAHALAGRDPVPGGALFDPARFS